MQEVEEKFGMFSNCSWHSVHKMKKIVQKGIVGRVHAHIGIKQSDFPIFFIS